MIQFATMDQTPDFRAYEAALRDGRTVVALDRRRPPASHPRRAPRERAPLPQLLREVVNEGGLSVAWPGDRVYGLFAEQLEVDGPVAWAYGVEVDEVDVPELSQFDDSIHDRDRL